MSLPIDLTPLTGKAAGDLIRSSDWNALVAAVQEIQTTLVAGLTDLGTQVQAVNNRVETLEGNFQQFRQSVEPLLNQYYRLTLETTRPNYAVGESALLTARVTDLSGNPLPNPIWIDFVSTWGYFREAPGFDRSLTGVGDRSISVQTNARGIAQVLLRSERAEGLTDDDEEEINTTLATRIPATNKRIVDTILEASNPAEARVAYQVLNTTYDTSIRARTYLDAYYLRNAPTVSDRITPASRIRWRDYRSTVMAFARNDNDPVTPDQSRGISSTQITFRDWVRSWILDYVDITATDPVISGIRGRLAPKFTENLQESLVLVKREVDDIVGDRGLIGKQRDYKAIRTALDTLTATPFTQSIRSAIGLQQTLENAQVTAVGAPTQKVAFEAFADAATRVDTSTAEVKTQVTALVQQQVAQQSQALQTQVQQVRDQVSAFSKLNPDEVNTRFQDINNLKAQLSTLQVAMQQIRR
jgi:TolA-binding protein